MKQRQTSKIIVGPRVINKMSGALRKSPRVPPIDIAKVLSPKPVPRFWVGRNSSVYIRSKEFKPHATKPEKNINIIKSIKP